MVIGWISDYESTAVAICLEQAFQLGLNNLLWILDGLLEYATSVSVGLE